MFLGGIIPLELLRSKIGSRLQKKFLTSFSVLLHPKADFDSNENFLRSVAISLLGTGSLSIIIPSFLRFLIQQ